MMMKCDGRLDEALQESFFQTFGFAPYVFPDFMGVIEFAGVEEANSAVIAVGVHDHENTMDVEHDAVGLFSTAGSSPRPRNENRQCPRIYNFSGPRCSRGRT